jgi:hypothetical protein
MSDLETLARKAASVARRSGFLTIVSVSRSTESVYLYLGTYSRRGGFETFGTLRISCHRKPGWSRGGWLKVNGQPYFDLRPRSRRSDWERAVKFVERVRETQR